VSDEGRVLAIDPGQRRVGLAVSDPRGVVAQGLPTFDRRAGVELLDRLAELVDAYGVTRIVMGHPRSLAGRDTEATRLAEAMADEIRRRLAVAVELWDDRLTSAEARRVLAGSRADKKAVDRVAAVLILQGYLDAHPRASHEPDEEEM
jgi:putative pre-16S rRNA nuclease